MFVGENPEKLQLKRRVEEVRTDRESLSIDNATEIKTGMDEQRRDQWRLALILAVNLCCSISIVLVNKFLYVHYGFPNVTLTFIHFVITSLGLYICERLNVFSPKLVSIRRMIPLSVAFCSFVVFTNLSLQFNTVGTYQMLKTLTTPTIIIISYVYYGKTHSFKSILTLVPVIFGVFINSYYDIKFTVIGTAYAAIGVLVTSLYQILVGTNQEELGMNSMQLLYYQAPLSATLLGVFVVPWFENPLSDRGILHPWPLPAIGLVLLSGIIALMVNITIYWIIGNTSPVTYNMAGHLKFCTNMLGGYLLFQDPLQVYQLLGISMTFLGIMAYAYIKMAEAKRTVLPK